MKEKEYRVCEFDGKFTIQIKVISTKVTGLLWWKKEIEIIEWSEVNKYGNAVFVVTYPIYYRQSSIDKFNDLQSALDKIEVFKKGFTYHYQN